MSLNSLVYIVGTFWTALHILKRLFTCLGAKNGALLPFANQQQQTLTGRRRSRDVGALKLRYLQLHLETQTFNPAHDSLCTRLESSSTLKTLLIAFYDLGALCGVLGLMISLGVLAWAVLQLMMVLTSSLVVDDIPSPETRRVFKRSVPSHDVGTHESGPHDLLLNPIVSPQVVGQDCITTNLFFRYLV